ncbi:hypothetical protein GB937_002388 [Aspergillus fischeri]|nr:hypothetical protein GB937_002388 [Aspergillus fischeri]
MSTSATQFENRSDKFDLKRTSRCLLWQYYDTYQYDQFKPSFTLNENRDRAHRIQRMWLRSNSQDEESLA